MRGKLVFFADSLRRVSVTDCSVGTVALGGAVVGAVTTLWLTASSMRRQPQAWAEMVLDDEPRLYVGKLRANLQLRDPHETVDEGHVFEVSDD